MFIVVIYVITFKIDAQLLVKKKQSNKIHEACATEKIIKVNSKNVNERNLVGTET